MKTNHYERNKNKKYEENTRNMKGKNFKTIFIFNASSSRNLSFILLIFFLFNSPPLCQGFEQSCGRFPWCSTPPIQDGKDQLG